MDRRVYKTFPEPVLVDGVLHHRNPVPDRYRHMCDPGVYPGIDAPVDAPILRDNFRFCKSQYHSKPGGLFASTKPWMWLATGTGHEDEREARKTGEAPRDTVKVMACIRECLDSDIPFDYRITEERESGTIRLEHIVPGEMKTLRQWFLDCFESDPVTTLMNALCCNAYTAAFIGVHLPELLELGRVEIVPGRIVDTRDLVKKVQTAVTSRPAIAEYLPASFVTADLIARMQRRDQLPESFYDTEAKFREVFFTDPSASVIRWFPERMSRDTTCRLVREFLKNHPLRLWMVPEEFYTPRNINAFLNAAEQRFAREGARFWWSDDCPPESHLSSSFFLDFNILDASQFFRLARLRKKIQAREKYPPGWWTASRVEAVVDKIDKLDGIPHGLLTVRMLARYLEHANYYAKIPKRLRCAELDAQAVRIGHYALENYRCVTAKTVELSVLLVANSYDSRYDMIPKGHLVDPCVIDRLVHRAVFYVYEIVPALAHAVVDAAMMKRIRGKEMLRHVPAERRTDAMSEAADISSFPWMTETVAAKRRDEWEACLDKRDEIQYYDDYHDDGRGFPSAAFEEELRERGHSAY